MLKNILKADRVKEYYTPERCYISEVSNSSDDENTSIARARVSPGVTTAWHKLQDVEERYLVISGRGLAEIGDLPAANVTCGDVVLIPAGTRQRITNIGEEDLLFYAICTPRFTNECYIALKDESHLR
jgi:mannose-6-phosphate isomerase-like protein (cupin superfamily)